MIDNNTNSTSLSNLSGPIYPTDESSGSAEDLKKQTDLLRTRLAQLEFENELLRKSLERDQTFKSGYHFLYNSVGITCFTLSPDGIVLSANQTASVLLAKKEADLVGLAFVELLVPACGSPFQTFLSALLENPFRQHCRVRLSAAQGEWDADVEGIFVPESEVVLLVASKLTRCLAPSPDTGTMDIIRLQASHMAALMNCTSDLMISADQKGQIITFNEPFQHVVKDIWNQKASIGTNIFDIIPKSLHQRYQRMVERVLGGEKLTEILVYPSAKDADMYWEESFSPILAEPGEVIGFAVSSRNISEMNRVENNLMYRENVLQSIFNESADALFLTTIAENRIVLCNRRAVELFEAETEESLIGNPAYSLHDLLNPAEISTMNQCLHDTGFWSSEMQYVTTQGSVYWGHIRVKSIRISGSGYALVRVSDMTEKKQSEEKIKMYSDRLETILESTQDIIFSLDNRFCYTSFNTNHQRLMLHTYGIEIELGKNAIAHNKILHKDYKPISKDLLRAMKGEQFKVVRTIGSAKAYYEMYLNPIRSEAGEVSGVAVFARDISERKEGEERLLTSLREKEVLLSEVYHRVKNNLNVVVSLLTLQANRTNDPSVLEALNESKNRIYAMALVHEQLYRSGNMSKINTREYVISLARNVREVYLKQSNRIAVQIEVDLDIHFPLDISIPLGLMLNELLTNSFQHAFDPGQEGQVGIQLSSIEKQRYLMCVWDDGRGFDPVVMATSNPKSLGLRIVEMLVEQIKGKLHFRYTPRIETVDQAISDASRQNRIEIYFNYPIH
jgi:PAS domain S-box-containing protein